MKTDKEKKLQDAEAARKKEIDALGKAEREMALREKIRAILVMMDETQLSEVLRYAALISSRW